MPEDYHILSDDDYGYVFSYALENDVEIQTGPITDILNEVAEKLNITGVIEAYASDGYLHVDLPSPYIMTASVVKDSEAGRRIYRIGIGLNIENEEKLREKIKRSLANRFMKSVTGIEHAHELSEAATVGTIRESISPLVFIKYRNGNVKETTKMWYNN